MEPLHFVKRVTLAEPQPQQSPLVSIIILCCNEFAFTRLCLESLARHTSLPHELILVDNGSADETPSYLQDFAQQFSPGRLQLILIRNETNKGFAQGVNQGLQRAQGQFVLLLNNDVILTPHWLDDLVKCAQAGPGLVGPTSNYVPPPQLVEAGYEHLNDLEHFAEQRRSAFRGQAILVERLSGFCLLIRREVLDRIGRLDERFGVGFFEDDDLCFRAKDAGFRLAIALDVYLHHFGSRTFSGQQIPTESLLQSNFQRFQDKWGTERTAGYQMMKPLSAEAQQPYAEEVKVSPAIEERPATVSLCMIVKNEEDNLAACLDSVREHVNELVIVDTGSTDRTKEIAESYGAKVIVFPWVDSFAAARNIAIENATGDYIFWMDGDDRLDPGSKTKLQELFTSLKPSQMLGVSMKCVCLPDPLSGTTTVVDHIRLFPRHPEVRWRYRVHEQILSSIRRQGGHVQFSDITINHVGYQDPALRRRKLDRDIRLLELENEENPDDPFTLFNLGSVYLELDQPEKALCYLERSIERSHPSDSIVRKLFVLVVQAHKRLGQLPQALAACDRGRQFYPQDAELLFQEALLRRDQGDLAGAVQCLERLLTENESAHFASVDVGLRGYKARHNLAVTLREMGRLQAAESAWNQTLQEAPGFVPAWTGLAELYLAQERWQNVGEMIGRLQAIPGIDSEPELLKSRLHLAQKEFDQAKAILERLVTQSPQAIRLRILLSHVLLQEGKDWQAAEASLRDILQLDPQNQEARQNLTLLLKQQGKES